MPACRRGTQGFWTSATALPSAVSSSTEVRSRKDVLNERRRTEEHEPQTRSSVNPALAFFFGLTLVEDVGDEIGKETPSGTTVNAIIDFSKSGRSRGRCGVVECASATEAL